MKYNYKTITLTRNLNILRNKEEFDENLHH